MQSPNILGLYSTRKDHRIQSIPMIWTKPPNCCYCTTIFIYEQFFFSEQSLLIRACNQLGQFLTHRETNLRYGIYFKTLFTFFGCYLGKVYNISLRPILAFLKVIKDILYEFKPSHYFLEGSHLLAFVFSKYSWWAKIS